MKTIKYAFIIYIFLSYSTAFSQNNPQAKRAREIEAIKIGYITRKLDLSPEESQKFWPVYNQFQKELNKINIQKRTARLQNQSNSNEAIDAEFDFDTKILETKKRYRKEFAKILSSEKIKNLYLAERQFKEELIKQLRNRKENIE